MGHNKHVKFMFAANKCILHNQNAVAPYLKYKQLLAFGFAWQHCSERSQGSTCLLDNKKLLSSGIAGCPLLIESGAVRANLGHL